MEKGGELVFHSASNYFGPIGRCEEQKNSTDIRRYRLARSLSRRILPVELRPVIFSFVVAIYFMLSRRLICWGRGRGRGELTVGGVSIRKGIRWRYHADSVNNKSV